MTQVVLSRKTTWVRQMKQKPFEHAENKKKKKSRNKKWAGAAPKQERHIIYLLPMFPMWTCSNAINSADSAPFPTRTIMADQVLSFKMSKNFIHTMLLQLFAQ